MPIYNSQYLTVSYPGKHMQENIMMSNAHRSKLKWDSSVLGTGVSLSNNDLRATITSNVNGGIKSNEGKTTGAWYTEIKIIQVQDGWPGGATPAIGIASTRTPINNPYNLGPDELMLYSWAPSNNIVIYGAGNSFPYNAYATAGAIIGIGLDLNNKTLRFYPSGELGDLIDLNTFSSINQEFHLAACSSAAGGSPSIIDIQSTMTFPIPAGFQRW
jgi:hypothetical protein